LPNFFGDLLNFQKWPKIKNHPKGEKSPNLVNLPTTWAMRQQKKNRPRLSDMSDITKKHKKTCQTSQESNRNRADDQRRRKESNKGNEKGN
jgi:hypothetical protein